MSGRGALAALLFASFAACRGCERPPLDAPRAQTQAPATSERLTVAAAGKTALEMKVDRLSLRPHGSGYTLALAAGAARRSEWLFAVELTMGLSTGPGGHMAGALEGARCALRYLQDGRATQADYAVVSAAGRRVRREGGAELELTAVCRKLVEVNRAGAPHAPALPDEVELRGRLRAPQLDEDAP